jgi:hypothetical protein
MVEAQQLASEIKNLSSMLAAAHNTYTTYIKQLATLYGRVSGGLLTREEIVQDRAKINEIFTRLDQYNIHFGSNVNKFYTQTAPQIVAQLGTTATTAQILSSDFIKLADAFDECSEFALAEDVDKFLKNATDSELGQLKLEVQDLRNLVFGLISRINRMERKPRKADIISEVIKLANFSDDIGAYVLADELDKIAEEIIQPIQQPSDGNLSTRYCPDHNGVQAIRISERVYQCPIDGKVYNYETGYTNYKGQQVPGGSIAAQTPTTTDFGGIPMRIYDSRQTILNRIN